MARRPRQSRSMHFRRIQGSFFRRFPVLVAVVAGIAIILCWFALMPCEENDVSVSGGETKPTPSHPGAPGEGTKAPTPSLSDTGACVFYADVGGPVTFVKSRATSVSRRLALTGVDAPLFPMSALTNALAGATGVAHLVSPNEPTPAQMAALRAFLDRGGHLVVHYSEAPSLCSLFGVRSHDPQGVKAASGDWTGFRFAGPAPLHAPAVVAQRAPSIVELSPTRGDVRVLARWHDDTGREGPPAVLRGPAGFWLSRPLYDDLPAADSSRLLLSLSATLHPPLWKTAAKALEARLAEARDGASPDALRHTVPAEKRPQLEECLRRADAAEAARAEKVRQGLYGASMADLWEEERVRLLAEALATPLGPVRGKARLAVWAKGGWAPGTNTWESAAAALADSGVSDVYLFAGTLSGSIPAVTNAPAHPGRSFRGDPFPNAVKACHARGIRVHAWIFALQADLAEGARYADPKLTRRLLHTPKRDRRLPWLDPAVRANATDLSAFVCAVARDTGVDGVNLDYFRYPMEATNEKRDPAKLRALLARIRRDMRAAAPKCELSVSVYGYSEKVAQRWDDWLADGLMDKALVMNYAADLDELRRYMALHPARRDRQLCGLGAASYQALLSPRDLLGQMRAAYSEGYGGVAIYPFDERFLADYAEALRLAR